MFLEYFNLSNFSWDLPFHSDIFTNIAFGLLCAGFLIFTGYKLAGGKGALILFLAGVSLFAYWKILLPI